MKNFISRYIIQITIAFTAIILVWVSANLNWGDGRWNKLLKSDAKGYFAYLPAIFIYHDLSFNFLGKNPDDPVLSAPFVHKAAPDKEGVINKYYAGTAVAQLPFFLAGHVTSMVLGRPLDGYSSYYLIFIQVAAIFYALLAQFLLFRILSELNISKKIIALVIFTAIFGTNVYYYIVIEPGVTHIYSFAFVALFALSAMRFFSKPSIKYFLLGMFAIGMVVLIRPVNMLVLLSVPFLAGSLKNLNSGFRFLINHFLILLSGISVGFTCGFYSIGNL